MLKNQDNEHAGKLETKKNWSSKKLEIFDNNTLNIVLQLRDRAVSFTRIFHV